MKNQLLLFFLFLSGFSFGQEVELGVPLGHTKEVYSFSLSGDEELLVSGSADETFRLWELSTGRLLLTSPKYDGYMNDGGYFINQNQQIYFPESGPNYTPMIWDFSTNELKFEGELEAYQPMNPSSQPGTGKYQISDPDMTGEIQIQDSESGNLIRILKAEVSAKPILYFDSSDRILNFLDNQGHFRSWDLENNQILKSVQTKESGAEIKPQFIDDHRILIQHNPYELYLFDLSTDQTNLIYKIDREQKREFFESENLELFDLKLNRHSGNLLFDVREFHTTAEAVQLDLKTNIQSTYTNLDLIQVLDFHPKTGGVFQLVDIFSDDEDTTVPEGRYPALFDASGDQMIWKGDPFSTKVYARGQFSNSGKLAILNMSYPDFVNGLYVETGGLLIYDALSGTLISSLFLPNQEVIESFVLSQDEQQIALLGRNGSIQRYQINDGSLIQQLEGHQNAIIQGCFSNDQTKLVTAGSDSKLLIWDLKTGSLLATMITLDQSEWIVLSPNGLFDASPKAMEALYFVVNQKKHKETVEIESLKPRYYEPGLLQKILGYSNERLRDVENLTKIDLYPDIESSIENDQLSIKLIEQNGGIGSFSVQINGKEVYQDDNPEQKTNFNINLRDYQHFLYRNPDSTNWIGIQAFNRNAWLKSPIKKLKYEVSVWKRGDGNSDDSGWSSDIEAKMYVLCIGTSDYTGEALDLKYADTDAHAMAATLASVGTQLFSNGDSLEVFCMSTTEPTVGEFPTKVKHQFSSKANIKALLSEIQNRAKAEDILLVYLSGHGISYGSAENTQFYYLTHGVSSEDLSDVAIRNEYAISSGELTALLNKIPALKQVLVIDACNSGKVVEDLSAGTRTLNSSQIRALDRMKDRTGMFILSGSASDKVSYEASEYGQGLLTYSLLQGMLGLATRKTADGDYVDVMKLFQYSRDEVPKLAASIKGVQKPVVGIPKQASSFDIGILNEQVDIKMASKKPVFIRSNFLNQTLLKDNLKLNKQLETVLRQESEKGKDADLIYIDTNEYPKAYSLSGLYQEGTEQIEIQIKLFQGEKMLAELKPRPTNDPEKLAQLILREVKKAIAIQ